MKYIDKIKRAELIPYTHTYMYVEEKVTRL